MTVQKNPNSRLSIALVHYPCVDAQGAIYATAITNMDIHDISRTARTYGLANYYVITPLAAQQDLANAIKNHWCKNSDKRRHTHRAQALERVEVVASLEEAIALEEKKSGASPYVLATSAKKFKNTLTFAQANKEISERPSSILVLGTGHGLADSIMHSSHNIIEPILGKGDYNHLSVRSAAAILLDRLVN